MSVYYSINSFVKETKILPFKVKYASQVFQRVAFNEKVKKLRLTLIGIKIITFPTFCFYTSLDETKLWSFKNDTKIPPCQPHDF